MLAEYGQVRSELDSAGALGHRRIGSAPSLAISQRLNMVAKISQLRSRWGMNRVGVPATRADKLRAVSVIAGKLEPLPINEALFQTNAHQATVVGNAVEHAELFRAHFVARSEMTAEMLEALSAPWAKQAFTIEPGVDFRDRLKTDQDSYLARRLRPRRVAFPFRGLWRRGICFSLRIF
jgi:hypothetical protein